MWKGGDKEIGRGKIKRIASASQKNRRGRAEKRKGRSRRGKKGTQDRETEGRSNLHPL